MNAKQEKDINAVLKTIEEMDFTSAKDLEFLKKLNASVESLLQYAQAINSQSKK